MDNTTSNATPFNFQEKISSKIELDMGGHEFDGSPIPSKYKKPIPYVSILNRGEEEKTPTRMILGENMF